MTDRLNREINYLRISVTDCCNLRCTYCMPTQEVVWMKHEDLLRYEEIIRLCRLFAQTGISRVRLTGGEPLMRRELCRLVAGIRTVPGIERVSLTTNGTRLKELLPRLVQAGLTGVNISLDTLDRRQYAAITQRDALEQVLSGLTAALDSPLTVKLNCVAKQDNDDQLVPLAELARGHDIAVRFIELMPVGRGGRFPGRTEQEIRAILEHALGPMEPVTESMTKTLGAGPGHYFAIPGFRGKVGFISAVSHPFCGSCNRVRLTASGFLKTCLQYETGVDLRALLRSGVEDARILDAIRTAIQEKPAQHHFGQYAGQVGDETRNMNQIGG